MFPIHSFPFVIFHSQLSDENAMERLSISIVRSFRSWKRWKWDTASTIDRTSGWISYPWTPGCPPLPRP